jgi:hypothetical protein
MSTFQYETFSDRTVHVDGNEYERCKFVNSPVVYSGGEVPVFRHCEFNPPHFLFDGAAHRTLSYLRKMSEPDSGMQEVIRKAFPALFRR